MKYYLCCLLAVISIYSFPTSTVSAKQPVANSIGNIQNIGNIRNTEKESEAGCSLYRKGNKEFIFWSSGGDRSAALMNIDGKDRVFNFVSKTPVETQIEKRGNRSTVIYKFSKVIVRIDRVATKVCDSSHELDCTGTSYDAKISLSVGNRKQVISATGYCGC
jgi:hypothetical protein